MKKQPRLMVKIRKESDYYLAYFIELRKIIPLNYLGASIVNSFFNKSYSPEKITNLINSKKRIVKKEYVLDFLKELKKELLVPREGGYPVVDKELFEIPISVEVQLNTQCNLRCKHCCQPSYDKIMPVAQVKRILKILNEKKVFEINLTGGEPFLHPNIFELIQLSAEKYNFATIIITNGTLLTESLVKRLSKFRNNLAFLVSLEGVGKVNDNIRGKGVFKKVDRVLKILKKYDIYVEISSTINSWNINHYQELINYSKSLGIPLNFNLFKPFKESHKDLTLDPCQYFKFIEDIFKQRELYKTNIGLTNAAIVAKLTGKGKQKTCRATLSGLSINVEGRMVPCAFLADIGYYDKAELPKFDENFLINFKNNYYFKKFRRGNLQECQACSYIFSGDIKGKDPYGISAFLEYKKANA